MLYTYWSSLGDGSQPPYRHEIQPDRIKSVLPNAFILQYRDPEHIVFRLAGTQLCELYGREFRDQNFLQMWNTPERRSIQSLINTILVNGRAGLIEYTAKTFDKTSIPAEILLLPLRDGNGHATRVIGCVVHKASKMALGGKKIVSQSIDSVHLLKGEDEKSTPLVADHILNGTHPPYLQLVHSR
jgi:hypothetical protein